MTNINLYKVIAHIFMLALTVFEILRFEMFVDENVGQGHRVQHLQWFNLMTNINLCKSNSMHFYASSHRLGDIKV